jgi:hypothetical protein
MEFSLCTYKNLLGEPRKGIREYRILDISIVDFMATVVGAFVISNYFNIDFKIILFILLLLGIILHKLFCVETTVDKIIFKD